MTDSGSKKSVHEIAIEVANELGDIHMQEGLVYLRDHHSTQVARANKVLSTITAGLPESQDDGAQFEALAGRIDLVIRENLDSDSIWEFLLLCGTHMQSVRGIAADRSARAKFAKSGVLAKLAKDPKQKDKGQVKECWDEWRKQPSRYKSKAAFARDMREKFPSLESQPVIEGWCRDWERET